MNHNNDTNINWDVEFKRHLQILRPYLEQQLDQDVIEICNAWIKKLSSCKENEKPLRNKYVFTLCYQLAKGILDEPFLKIPPMDELPPLDDDVNSNDSLTEVEYLVIDSDNVNSKVLCNSRPSQSFTDNSGTAGNTYTEGNNMNTKSGVHIPNSKNGDLAKFEANVLCYDCPQVGHFANCNECDEGYQYRANNLIMKLREIKQQNVILHNELVTLKKESQKRHNDYSLDDSIFKVDNSTSTCLYNQGSSTTLLSLKGKLQEVQQSRNDLIETVACLQEKLDNFNEMKRHEIEELEAKHKLEVIKIKTNVREEMKSTYENKSNELKKQYESVIFEMQRNTRDEIENFISKKEHMVAEKDKLLQNKDVEINKLKCEIEELKSSQFNVLSKFLDGTNDNSADDIRVKAHDLQKRLNKMERTKNRYAKVYEAKIASLQREKHLAECSLQLQLVKQRAQVVNEMSDENQAELATALDKLENKYKEIVANVQATAVQRRLQDQIALESIIQTVCGIPNESLNSSAVKTMRNQTNEASRDREYRTVCGSNTVDNASAGHKSFGDDTIVTGYYLDSEKLGELFERMHIPQRDVSETPK